MQINNSKLNKELPVTSKNLIKILDDWKIIYFDRDESDEHTRHITITQNA